MIAKTILPMEIGMCSWSLRTAGWAELKTVMDGLQLRILHLSLCDVVNMNPEAQAEWMHSARDSGLLVSAGMIGFADEDYSTLATIKATGGFVPDADFETRLQRVVAAGKIARQMGITILTTHAGFLPSTAAAVLFQKMIQRLQWVADALAESSITLLFETGQEKPEDLAAFLKALRRPNVGINLDPANLILYGSGVPPAAVKTLGPWIRHIHAKDARREAQASGDQWRGRECALGEGDAQLAQVLPLLWGQGYRGPVAIEWEGGGDGLAALRKGVTFLRGITDKITSA